MEENKDSERYVLTVKGWLSLELNLNADEIQELWSKFANFVELQARRNGYTGRYPALIFDGGGECITMDKEKEKD